MTKKILLFLILGSVFLFIVNAFFVPKQTKPVSVAPTPLVPTQFQQYTVRNQTNSDFYVIKVDPAGNDYGLPINQKITIEFNRPFTLNDIAIYFSPDISYTTNIQNNTLIITPSSLTQDTIYTYSIRDANLNLLTVESFSVGNSKTPQLPAKGDDNLESYWNQQQIATHPDFFVANTLSASPQPMAQFQLTDTPYTHYQFIITSQDKTAGKNQFISWLTSLGLTNEDIVKLDIVTN